MNVDQVSYPDSVAEERDTLTKAVREPKRLGNSFSHADATLGALVKASSLRNVPLSSKSHYFTLEAKVGASLEI